MGCARRDIQHIAQWASLYGAEELVGCPLPFSSSHSARTIWIDAICIDQNNVLERNHQVRNMVRIYAQAEHVLIWLREAAGGSSLAMDVIRAGQWA